MVAGTLVEHRGLVKSPVDGIGLNKIRRQASTDARHKYFVCRTHGLPKPIAFTVYITQQTQRSVPEAEVAEAAIKRGVKSGKPMYACQTTKRGERELLHNNTPNQKRRYIRKDTARDLYAKWGEH